MQASDVRRFVELSRRYVEKVLAFNGIATRDGTSLFDDGCWRTFWYDPVSGLAAMSAWNANKLGDKKYFLHGPRASSELAQKGMCSIYQLPPAVMLPMPPHDRYAISRVGEVDVEKFKLAHPSYVLMIEIPTMTERWMGWAARRISL